MNIMGETVSAAEQPAAEMLIQSVHEASSRHFSSFDTHLFREGTHCRLHRKLGAHIGFENGIAGTWFALWAPTAQRVYVGGDFNDWNFQASPLSLCGDSGIWCGFVAGANYGAAYQYEVVMKDGSQRLHRTDPFSWRLEGAPRHASLVWDLDFTWKDGDWMRERARRNSIAAPISIYQIQLASWRRVPEEGNRWLTYREMIPHLVEHLRRTNFTHVLIEPILQPAEWFPRDRYVAGFFAADSRFGTPQDLMALIDELHQNGFGLLLRWDPTCFPKGEHGLASFDGTPLYELDHEDTPARPERHFDLHRPEVRSFLLSSALFWIERFHFDGLLAETEGGEKVPAGFPEIFARLLRQLNTEVKREHEGAFTIATAADWPASTTGWAGDQSRGFTLVFDREFQEAVMLLLGTGLSRANFPEQKLSGSARLEYKERFVLPLPGPAPDSPPGSLFSQMPGDDWQRAANYKLLLGIQWLQPGKKLLFMGNEFAQWQPWNPLTSLDWHLLGHPPHRCILRWFEDLNRTYREEPGLHRGDCESSGFEGIGTDGGTLSWLRRDHERRDVFLIVCNLTAAVRHNFFVGVRRPGYWREVLNSDSKEYGGSEQGNFGGAGTSPFSTRGMPYSLTLTLPPLAVCVFKHQSA